MTITFNQTDKFKAAKETLSKVLSNEESTELQHQEAFEEYLNVLQSEVTKSVSTQVNDEMLDRSILQQRGQHALTSEEMKFFNQVVEASGFTDDSILPIATQERVFEDLIQAHPLLDALDLQDLGAVARYIYADPTKAYAWGPLFGGIAGQVSAAFKEEQIGQMKLTAFAAIPNDMLELGPVWVERYVRTLLVESYSVGLEYGFINGTGANQPIGLIKDVNPDTQAVTDKVSSGTLTFAPSQYGETVAGELYGVINDLSTNAKGDQRDVLNRVVMVVNPVNALGVQARNTIQTANGQWVTALPYNIQVVPSSEVPADKAIFFVRREYIAVLAGGYRLKKFDQTLAMEDATLYTIKQFANGKPKDNKAALVYDLNVTFETVPQV